MHHVVPQYFRSGGATLEVRGAHRIRPAPPPPCAACGLVPRDRGLAVTCRNFVKHTILKPIKSDTSHDTPQLARGSQVASAAPDPFHFRRYSTPPALPTRGLYCHFALVSLVVGVFHMNDNGTRLNGSMTLV